MEISVAYASLSQMFCVLLAKNKMKDDCVYYDDG